MELGLLVKKSLISKLRVNSASTKLGVKGDPWVNGKGRFQSHATGKEIDQIDPTRRAESLKHVNHLSVSCFLAFNFAHLCQGEVS